MTVLCPFLLTWSSSNNNNHNNKDDDDDKQNTKGFNFVITRRTRLYFVHDSH